MTKRCERMCPGQRPETDRQFVRHIEPRICKNYCGAEVTARLWEKIESLGRAAKRPAVCSCRREERR